MIPMPFRDNHVCYYCKKKQIYYCETWLCPDCDWEQVWDLFMNHRMKKNMSWERI